MLVGIGTIIAVADPLIFWTIVAAAAVGAALGDWLSYWVGYHYHAQIQQMWPLKNHPKLLDKGRVFFKRWGAGDCHRRFSGPLRANVPIVAGIAEMPWLRFQIANWGSAFLWAFVCLSWLVGNEVVDPVFFLSCCGLPSRSAFYKRMGAVQVGGTTRRDSDVCSYCCRRRAGAARGHGLRVCFQSYKRGQKARWRDQSVGPGHSRYIRRKSVQNALVADDKCNTQVVLIVASTLFAISQLAGSLLGKTRKQSILEY